MSSFEGTRQHSLGDCNGTPGASLLFASLARAAEQRMGEVNAQELATRPGRLQRQARRSHAVPSAGKGNVAALGKFDTQELANTAWAFATADQADAHLSAALARESELRVGSGVASRRLQSTGARQYSTGIGRQLFRRTRSCSQHWQVSEAVHGRDLFAGVPTWLGHLQRRSSACANSSRRSLPARTGRLQWHTRLRRRSAGLAPI